MLCFHETILCRFSHHYIYNMLIIILPIQLVGKTGFPQSESLVEFPSFWADIASILLNRFSMIID